MTHPGSGNPTWQDYPNTSTPVTAAALEAIESALDNAAAGPHCEVRLTVSASIPAVTDLWAQGNWAAHGGDPFGMVKTPPGSGTYTYIQIPAGWPGRYSFRYHSTTAGMGQHGTHAGKITLNAVGVANSIGTSANTAPGAGADGATIDVLAEVTLAAGDRIYWGNYASVAATIPAVPSAIPVPTAIFARYLGPA